MTHTVIKRRSQEANKTSEPLALEMITSPIKWITSLMSPRLEIKKYKTKHLRSEIKTFLKVNLLN